MFIMILKIVKRARGMILINSKKVMRVKLPADCSLKMLLSDLLNNLFKIFDQHTNNVFLEAISEECLFLLLVV